MDEDIDDARSPARVRDVYEAIAGHFSETRAYPWPEVTSFLDGRDGRVGLDIGCGNGRHTDPLAGVVESTLAVDVSRNLLVEARERMVADGWDAEVAVADATRLPVVDGVVDVGVYVATLHHLPDRERRVESLRELCRVLAPGGCALVSAWSTAHDRFEGHDEGFDTTIDWTLPGGESIPRFYHIYAPAEFERDLDDAGLTTTSTYVSSGNCYAEVEGKHP